MFWSHLAREQRKKRALVPTLVGPLEDQGQGGTILKHCPYLAERASWALAFSSV